MATDLATIGLQVTSDQVSVASNRLNTFTQSAQKVDTATGKLNAQLKQNQSQMTSSEKAATSLTKAFRTLGITITAAYAFKTISDFEQSMASVRAVTRATNEEFAALREKAKELGANTRFTAAQAAEAMRFLGQAGLNTNEILTASADVLSLAQAGGLGLADAAEIASKALRGFSLDASQMGEVADLMAKAFTAANTNVQELGTAFRYVAPVATAFGVSMTDTTAAVAALSDAGISASMAGSSLRNIMTRLANPTGQARKALEAAGLSAEKLDIKARGLIPVLEALANSSLTVEQAFTIFGQRGGPAFEVLREAIPKLQRFSEEWKDLGGFAAETARIMDDNVQGALKRFISAIEYMFIQTSEASGGIDLVKNSLDGLAAVILAVTNSPFTQYIDEVVVALVLYTASTKAAALSTKLLGTTIGYNTAFVKLLAVEEGIASAATYAFSRAITTLRTALMSLLASPVTWIVAFGTAFYMLFRQFQAHQQQLASFRESFMELGVAMDETNKEFVRQNKLLESSKALHQAQLELDELEKGYARLTISISAANTAAENMATMSSHLYSTAARIGSAWEIMWGYKKTTLQAAEILKTYYKNMEATTDETERAILTTRAFNELATLQQLDKGNAAIGKAIDEFEAYSGGAEQVAKALKKVEDAQKEVEKATIAVSQALAPMVQEIADFMAVMETKKFTLPRDLNEAYEALESFTSGTKLAKDAQFELEKSAAAAAIAIYYQRAAIAMANGDLAEYTFLLSEAAKYQARVAEAVKTYDSKNSGGGESKQQKFMQSALDKQQELLTKIKTTQLQIAGATDKTLAVYNLQTQKIKEIEDLNRRAAEAGMLSSDALQRVQQLTNELYDMQIAAAEFEAEWDSVIRKQKDSVDYMSALGRNTQVASLQLKKLERAMVDANTSLDFEEKVRQLKLMDAEIASLTFQARYAIDGLTESDKALIATMEIENALNTQRQAKFDFLNQTYEATISQQNVLLGQMEGLKQAYDEGLISLDAYNAKMVELQLNFAQVRQQMGESTFAEDVSLALGSITEGYEGVAAGLTSVWGDFFSSFTTGFADSIGQAIVQGEDLNETLGNVARQAIASLISSLIQLGIQWAVNAALGTTLAATQAAAATAAGTAAASALNAAWTPAATAASIATLGGAAAAGSAGMIASLAATKAAYTIGGFQKGGYTGDIPTDQIAGFVHGGEYVMDAASVKNIGIDNLDTLRNYSGSSNSISSKGGGLFENAGPHTNLNVIIENNAPGVAFDVEKMDEQTVRIIAREEAQDVVQKDTPKMIATELSDPNSRGTKSLKQNFNVTSKH